jgi:3-phenylpropionate/trans-cinnamate dioxygenase ferredoxin reductase component
MVDRETVLIVGGGQAGAWAATTLRSEGFDGRVVLAGAEPHPPYERPPLSKSILTGGESHRAYLRPGSDYAQLQIDLRVGAEVTRLDLVDRNAWLRGGDRIKFDKLILATGSTVRHLRVAGAELANVVYLRTLDDAIVLRRLLMDRPRTVIIGGGFIGLEVAASAKAMQCEVTVLEVQSGIMRRVAPPEIAVFFERLHRDRGVAIHTGAAVRKLEGDKEVRRVACVDGRHFAADLVVVAIGIAPETALAEAGGLMIDDGIAVDAFGRTSHPAVFAAGDVTSHPNDLLGRRVRLESWQNAQNQAVAVAKAVCGKPVPYCELPWFWSDQFDVNLQMAGMPARWDDVVVRGNTSSGNFSIFYLQQQRVVGVSAINSPRDIAIGRRLIERRMPIRSAELADTQIQLKTLLK